MRNKIPGIYKITSPSGAVYIGQSVDVPSRWSKYRTSVDKKQRFIYNSFQKYGVNNHIFEIIHQLPKDVSREVLNTYELLYWQLYKDCGCVMMNIREPGWAGRNSEETKRKMSENNYNKKHPGKLSPSWGKKLTPEHIAKCVKSRKEGGKNRKFGSDNCRFGKKQPDSFLEICRKKVINKNTGEVFHSVRQAAEFVGICETTLCKYLKGKLNNTRFPYLEYYNN